jgi:hypothetical protein
MNFVALKNIKKKKFKISLHYCKELKQIGIVFFFGYKNNQISSLRPIKYELND